MEQTANLYISNAIARSLPAMVRNELAKMDPQRQEEFVEEFMRRRKNTGMGYLCWFIFGIHYGYLHKWGLQVVYWLTAGGFFIWAFIDLFRMSGLIKDYNKDLAMDVMRNLKAISG